MHALRHVHRLLVRRGALVDLHPISEEEIEARGRPLGVIREQQFIEVDLPNAEACVRDAVRDGLFAFEAEQEFDFLHHFDEAEEVLDAREEELAGQPALASRIREAAPPFRLRAHVVLRRLKKTAENDV